MDAPKTISIMAIVNITKMNREITLTGLSRCKLVLVTGPLVMLGDKVCDADPSLGSDFCNLLAIGKRPPNVTIPETRPNIAPKVIKIQLESESI